MDDQEQYEVATAPLSPPPSPSSVRQQQQRRESEERQATLIVSANDVQVSVRCGAFDFVVFDAPCCVATQNATENPVNVQPLITTGWLTDDLDSPREDTAELISTAPTTTTTTAVDPRLETDNEPTAHSDVISSTKQHDDSNDHNHNNNNVPRNDEACQEPPLLSLSPPPTLNAQQFESTTTAIVDKNNNDDNNNNNNNDNIAASTSIFTNVVNNGAVVEASPGENRPNNVMLAYADFHDHTRSLVPVATKRFNPTNDDDDNDADIGNYERPFAIENLLQTTSCVDNSKANASVSSSFSMPTRDHNETTTRDNNETTTTTITMTAIVTALAAAVDAPTTTTVPDVAAATTIDTTKATIDTIDGTTTTTATTTTTKIPSAVSQAETQGDVDIVPTPITTSTVATTTAVAANNNLYDSIAQWAKDDAPLTQVKKAAAPSDDVVDDNCAASTNTNANLNIEASKDEDNDNNNNDVNDDEDDDEEDICDRTRVTDGAPTQVCIVVATCDCFHHLWSSPLQRPNAFTQTPCDVDIGVENFVGFEGELLNEDDEDDDDKDDEETSSSSSDDGADQSSGRSMSELNRVCLFVF
jgi:hypothetical protein